MNLISIADGIFIWDVLAWTTPRLEFNPPVRSASENQGQPRLPPEPFKYPELSNHTTAKAMTRSISNSELEKTSVRPMETKKSSSIPSSRRHFIQKINHSHLAKVNVFTRHVARHCENSLQKRYVPPAHQETLRLHSILGYNGNGRENLVWHAHSGFFAYSVGCNVIVENLNNNHQTILIGKGLS